MQSGGSAFLNKVKKNRYRERVSVLWGMDFKKIFSVILVYNFKELEF